MARAKKPEPVSNGAIIYEGPSQIDGAPIVVIVTGFAEDTDNTKTGAMLQSWVLRSDVAPHTATKTGQDSSVCGDCGHRGTVSPVDGTHGYKRKCYVRVWQAPRSIFGAYKRGRYPRVTFEQLRELVDGRKKRLGSYGDPAAAPLEVWEAYASGEGGHTGYTHAWRTCDPDYAVYCMASCDTPEDRWLAKAMGYRTFRVRFGAWMDGIMDRAEQVCGASAERGHRTTCAKCMACGGTSSKAKCDMTINDHN